MEDVCTDCTEDLFPHLTELAVRQYLRELVSYLDFMDEDFTNDPDWMSWRAVTSMERAGI